MNTKKIKQIPLDGWEGLKQNFSADAMSGFMVFLLAFVGPSINLKNCVII